MSCPGPKRQQEGQDFSSLVLARERQGLVVCDQGVRAGAKVSPAQIVCSPADTVLQGLSQAWIGPCKGTRHGKTLLPLGSAGNSAGDSCAVRVRDQDRTGNKHLHSTTQGREVLD